METHVPEWMLERYLLDELPRKERRRLERELERNPALRLELENLRRDDRRVLAAYPCDQAIPQILKRAALARPQAASPRRRRLAWVAAPALALAILLLVILPPILQRRLAVSGRTESEDYIGTKGGGPVSLLVPGLQVFRRSGGAREIMRGGDLARAGDLLQLAYTPGRQTHGVILSIDGAGGVTLHFPDREEGDTSLQRGRSIPLPDAYELDRAPRFERFFFITATEPLPVAVILNKARQLAGDPEKAMTDPLDLPGHYGHFSLLLRK